jgi:hypothetical protein
VLNSAGGRCLRPMASDRMTKTARDFLKLVLLSVAAPLTAFAASQTIAFDAIPNQIFGVSPFVIAARASSGLPVTLTPTLPAVCAMAGDLVILRSVGTCSITASQGGNGTFSAALPVTRTFTVSQAKAGGSFTAAANSPFTAGASPRSRRCETPVFGGCSVFLQSSSSFCQVFVQ